MTAPYRSTPDGPFTLRVTLDASAHDALRRAWRGRGAGWLVLFCSPALTVLSLAVPGAATGLPIAATLAVVAHLAFVAYAWRTSARRAAAARAKLTELEVTIAEQGVDIAGDGGHRHWDWSHVASVSHDSRALVLFDPYDQAVVVPATAHPELGKIAAFARARATGVRHAATRGLGLVVLVHAALVLLALAAPIAPRRTPGPVRRSASESVAAPTPVDRVEAALERGGEPDPADLAAPGDLCDRADLAIVLADHGRHDLLPDLAPVDAARVHLAMTSGPCSERELRVLGQVEATDPVFGRCVYVALALEDFDAIESWWLVGPEIDGPGPSLLVEPPEWIEDVYSDDALVRRAAARHWVVLGRGPIEAPRVLR